MDALVQPRRSEPSPLVREGGCAGRVHAGAPHAVSFLIRTISVVYRVFAPQGAIRLGFRPWYVADVLVLDFHTDPCTEHAIRTKVLTAV